ncbi:MULTISPECIES: histidine phosphatase family protein [Pseudanabaena]|uniref:Phosphoglycerate mutase n=2 Tax=Pseudanabaena TaxID=1152 RepID=L8MUH9_9CYAN|nr:MULTISPECIES: histidine phosphatase family protein [Pseudanabaena]ELS31116.1 Phosphoglycerate mutase [Pseudanabaena biceps PCC 7429]MDG3496614.1 histidine phosphatase family protein [Pseudanabaena catenata USMAC16]
MSLNLYLLRHGETIYSRTGGYCGELDPELTDNGAKMAIAFGKAHQAIAWDAVFVSPMKRTIATAKPLCEAIGAEMQFREGLKELRYGKWEGLSNEFVRENYKDDYLRWLSEPAWNPPTGGETAVQLASRASLVVAEIQESYPSGNVLVVSHKATIRVILCNLLGIDLGRYRDRIDVPAASLSVVQFGALGPMLKLLGDRSFMDAELRVLSGT